MKRVVTVIFIWALLNACFQSDGPIDINSIRIVKAHQHPILVDHERKLITVDKRDIIIDEVEIYPDTGDGCESFLFDSDSKYIFIDCDGHWFSIIKRTGQIKDEGWKWEKEIPAVHLGKFKHTDGQASYTFTTGTGFRQTDIYKFKDPR